MKNYEYHSQLAPYISGLIRQKRADGYSYEFEAYMLEHFDRFCIENRHDNGSLTRDLVMAWAEQRPTGQVLIVCTHDTIVIDNSERCQSIITN